MSRKLIFMQYIVTEILIGACCVVYVLEMLNPQLLYKYGLYAAPLAQQGYYRAVTYAFFHGGLYHILANMASFFNIGSFVESYYGKVKYSIILLSSLILSSLSIVTLSSSGSITIGFSGVIFGLFGAFISIMVKTGNINNGSVSSMIMRMLVPNIIISLMPGVSWQGHLGGFIGGIVAGFLVGFRTIKNDSNY